MPENPKVKLKNQLRIVNDMKSFKLIMFFFILLSSFSGYSGERGYFVFVWGDDISKKTFIEYRENSNEYIKNKECWAIRYGDGISIAYVNLVPNGINIELVNRALSGDASSISQIQYILKNYRDDQITHGFDGMLIMKENNNMMSVLSIPLYGSLNKVQQEYKANINKYEFIDKLLCESLSPFDRHFIP